MRDKLEPNIESDATGSLYDRRVREHLERDVPADEVATT
jgi:hypothetical protein